MPRSRLALAVLVLALSAAACGDGGDASAEDDGLGIAAPEVEQPLSTAPSTTASEVERSAAPTPSTVPTAPSERIQLGTRFQWCAEIQAVWNRHDSTLADLVMAETRHQRAGEALGEATDELDRAEATEALSSAWAAVEQAQSAYRDPMEAAHSQLYRATNPHLMDSERVALERAVSAVSEADPDAGDGLVAYVSDYESVNATVNVASSVWGRADDDYQASRYARDEVETSRRGSSQPITLFARRSEIDEATRRHLAEVGFAARDAAEKALEWEADLERELAAWVSLSDAYGVAAEAFEDFAVSSGAYRVVPVGSDDSASSSTDLDAANTAISIARYLSEPLAAINERIIAISALIEAERSLADARDIQHSSEAARDASIEAILPSGSTDSAAYTAFRGSLQESCAP